MYLIIALAQSVIHIDWCNVRSVLCAFLGRFNISFSIDRSIVVAFAIPNGFFMEKEISSSHIGPSIHSNPLQSILDQFEILKKVNSLPQWTTRWNGMELMRVVECHIRYLHLINVTSCVTAPCSIG